MARTHKPPGNSRQGAAPRPAGALAGQVAARDALGRDAAARAERGQSRRPTRPGPRTVGAARRERSAGLDQAAARPVPDRRKDRHVAETKGER